MSGLDNRLKEARTAQGLTQARLAEAVGVPSPPVPPADPGMDRWRAIYDPQLEKLCREAYPRDYLMFGFSDFDTKNPA